MAGTGGMDCGPQLLSQPPNQPTADWDAALLLSTFLFTVGNFGPVGDCGGESAALLFIGLFTLRLSIVTFADAFANLNLRAVSPRFFILKTFRPDTDSLDLTDSCAFALCLLCIRAIISSLVEIIGCS